MLGEIYSLSAAFLWAGSMIVAAKTLKEVDPLSANAFKTLFSAVSMFIVALAMGGLPALFRLDLNGALFVILAAIIGFGIGDTCLFRSIGLIGASRSYTIGYSYPFLAIALATLLLGEPFQLRYMIGAVIIFFAITSIFIERNIGVRETNKKGFTAAIAAAVCWAVGTVLVAFGLRTINVIQANTIRFPLLFAFLFSMSRLRKKQEILSKKNLFLLLLSGLLGMTAGGLIFLLGVKLIGVSRASTLSSSSPIWASIMSSIYLKERVSRRVIVSSLMVTAGTYFLI